MSDPMMQPDPAEPPRGSSLFTSTSRQAGAVAARMVGSRRQRILQLIRDRGSVTIFEAAEAMDLGDNQISGRFSELERDGLIRKSGQRRLKPGTDCQAEVYILADQVEPHALDQQLDRLGYPPTLTIGGELFDRGVVPEGETLAGIPYSRRADAGGARLHWRVEFVESPCCGRPLIYRPEQIAGQTVKRFACTAPGCKRVYELAVGGEPGRGPFLILVLKHL